MHALHHFSDLNDVRPLRHLWVDMHILRHLFLCWSGPSVSIGQLGTKTGPWLARSVKVKGMGTYLIGLIK